MALIWLRSITVLALITGFIHQKNQIIIKSAIVLLATLLLWNLPSSAFGIEGLTIVQQRVIAIFAFATLMWILEIVPSWATSVSIIVMMLLFTSNSGINFMVDEEKVGKLLSYKDIMACFADPVIMLFIGGFILAIAATKTGLDAQLARILLKPFGTKSTVTIKVTMTMFLWLLCLALLSISR